jgi:multiple sugar transport system permease protein
MNAKRNIKFSQILLHLFLIVLMVLLLYPLGMALWSALKDESNFSATRWFPTLPLYFSNLGFAFPKVIRYIFNTVLVASVGCMGVMFVASLASYAFSRMQFYGKNILYMAVIMLMMIPGILTLVPSYMLYKSLLGLDNYLILIVPVISGGSVFGVFLLRAFFEGLPESIFEAARIDGANEFRVYRSICIPLSIPIMGTLAIIQINNVWNDYMWPMITIKSNDMFTISAGLLMNYVSAYTSNYPALFAAYLLSSIPLIFLFIFANKYYVEGLTSSAMKL